MVQSEFLATVTLTSCAPRVIGGAADAHQHQDTNVAQITNFKMVFILSIYLSNCTILR